MSRVIPRPLNYVMLNRCAKALWDQHRSLEGRVPWEAAPEWVKEPYIKKAELVLETAMPQDVAVLERLEDEIHRLIEIL